MSSRIVLLVCVLLCACDSDPGVGIGHFHVVSTRGTNACGAQSMDLAPRIEYDVELKAGGSTLTWLPAAASSASGTWDPTLHNFRIVLEQDAVAWPPDRRYDILGCTVHRTDVIEGTVTMQALDAGVDPDAGQIADAAVPNMDAGSAMVARSFHATETIVFGPAPGSDCRALIGARDGQFSTMPCDVTYTLDGLRM